MKIERDELKDVALPESMKRSMSKQAEAERERHSRKYRAYPPGPSPPAAPSRPFAMTAAAPISSMPMNPIGSTTAASTR
nr:hypothetical protein [Pseudofrankia sp. DC12]